MERAAELSAGRQVLLLFGLVCAILTAIAALLFFGLRSIEYNTRLQQSQSQSEVTLIEDTSQNVAKIQAVILWEVLADDPLEIRSIDQTLLTTEKTDADNFTRYKSNFVYSDEENKLCVQAFQARQNFLAQTQRVRSLALQNRDAEAKRLINSTEASAYDAYVKSFQNLTRYVQDEARENTRTQIGFISRIRLFGDALTVAAIIIFIGTGTFVVRIARRLRGDNLVLQAEIAARKAAEETLRGETALLEAQVSSSIDGILVVDSKRKKVLQNDRLAELWKIPANLSGDYEEMLAWATNATKESKPFAEKVAYLYSHPNETSRDEIELKDGTTLDRYTSPVIGKDGKYYGRIWSFRDITERKLSEERMARLREEHLMVLNSVSEGMYWVDLKGEIRFGNAAAAEMLGYEIAELTGKPAHATIHHSHSDGELYAVADCAVHDTLADGVVRHVKDEVFWRKDGTSFPVEYTTTPFRDRADKLDGTIVVFTDVTDRKGLEARMFQAQKMETVGKLAGGVAHEFNSILTAIMGQAELLLADLPPNDPLARNVQEIARAAERAATLTRQLLAYGRKQILQPEILDLNEVLQGMIGTLQHLMGRETDVRLVSGAALKKVKIDPGQIEQVIVNIAMNAADAMPNGGQLTLEAANVTLGEEYVRPFAGLKAGGYVLLAITDTGLGMSDEVKTRAFDPFFSTKGVGEGTGLGLAMCYGIINQSEGHIGVYSEIARGTTFKIYLPEVEAPTPLALPRLSSPDLPHGSETILLAEDDPSLLEMSATLLRRLGYTVFTAVNGVEALSLKQQRHIGHIDLLYTDVVMPHMSGKELSDRIRAIYPQTKILFTSAYTENAIIHQGMFMEGVMLLQKPFTPSALANKVREVLDRKS